LADSPKLTVWVVVFVQSQVKVKPPPDGTWKGGFACTRLGR